MELKRQYALKRFHLFESLCCDLKQVRKSVSLCLKLKRPNKAHRPTQDSMERV